MSRQPRYTFPIGIKIEGSRLTPLQLTKLPKESGANLAYLLRCDCGKTTEVSISGLRRGVKSCGCSRQDANRNRKLTRQEAIEAFLNKTRIAEDNSCWIWQGYRNKDGYGFFWWNNRVTGAHRVSWMIYKSDIPIGLSVLHHCDNPSCVNPNHLFLGTQADNMRDCALKKRIVSPGRRGEQSSSKLTNSDICRIRQLAASGSTRTKIADDYGVCRQSIDNIVNRKTWAHLPPVAEQAIAKPESDFTELEQPPI